MSLSLLFKSLYHYLLTLPTTTTTTIRSRNPFLYYAGIWTALLTLTVAIASFSPEMAFVSAISPSSSYSKTCNIIGHIRLPLDFSSGDKFCFPSTMVKRSSFDVFIPTLFAGLVVAGSAILLRALGLQSSESTQDDRDHESSSSYI